MICLGLEPSIKLSSLALAVRAGTGGDEAGIWAGDLVGRTWSNSLFLMHW